MIYLTHWQAIPKDTTIDIEKCGRGNRRSATKKVDYSLMMESEEVTRMHSSTIRTVRCGGRLWWGGGVCQTPPLWTESQTGVKTLPCRNYVANGKNAELINYMATAQGIWMYTFSDS